MTVLIDMDGVVCDLMNAFLTEYNKEYPEDHKIESDIVEWDVEKFLCSHARERRFFDSVLARPGFFLGLDSYSGALEAVNKIASKHDVVFCSAPHDAQCCSEKYQWLAEHFQWFTKKNLILAHRKDLVSANFFIDDSAKNISENASPNKYLIERPWNSGENIKSYSLKTILEAI